MLIELKNNDGYIYAYMSFNVVDEYNHITSQGTEALINGYWIHENYRWNTKNIFRYFVNKVFWHEECRNIEYFHWIRDDGRKRCFAVSKFLRYVVYDKINVGDKNDCKERNRKSEQASC